MKIKKLKNKSFEELKKTLAAARAKLKSLRFERALGGKIKDNQEMKKTKKEIARVLTLINL
ncbi:MAG: 50S ribosomal protein L29 [Parcubacteria group bacterium]|nr:50S ribosomal protein L29 [Parcubacteria group bacterium]